MNIINKFSTEQLEQICYDALLWNRYDEERKQNSLLNKTKIEVQQQTKDKSISNKEIVNMTTVELLRRKTLN